MKKILPITMIAAALMLCAGCNDFLTVTPTNKVTADAVVSSPAGIEAFLANLYYNLPIEGFDFTAESNPCPDQGYRDGFHFNDGAPNNSWRVAYILTDEAMGSQINDIPTDAYYSWWVTAFEHLHDLNAFYELLPTLTSIDEKTRTELEGQTWFIRGMIYFALARRYGGLPIIMQVGSLDDLPALKIPRSTEVETWNFVLECFDKAARMLSEEDNGFHTMANRWTALAYKSRASLHAASLAKFWNRAPLTGQAVDEKLVGGFTEEDRDRWYQECLDCSRELIESGRFSLYMPHPSSPAEATENYMHMFQRPEDALCESIFVKGFYKKGRKFGTNQDVWGQPAQTGGAWPHPGRVNPTLEFAENFENYDNPGESAKFVTYDGERFDYDGYKEGRAYRKFDDPLEMFEGKDARLAAITILPGSVWRNTKIVIQCGVVDLGGKIHMDVDADFKAQYIGWDGQVHYQFGAADNKFFSGFSVNLGNNTRTGFGFKKYMDPNFVSSGSVWNESTTDWIDIRLAEILLDYAEAYAESGLGDAAFARECLNRTRRRAGHTVDIDPTPENVQRERLAELGMENARQWDLVRRREFHQIFDGYRRGALSPILDLRDGKTFFVRGYVQKINPLIFREKYYYRSIPGWATSGLVKNPQQ
ncbi:MAG: RagB/SusD family nutrient uptake outer membrane protein [Bacteroidales bacterium]|nr:RagB/SusD family nutrient uptake outer membrane protein [Bacteroidales bacterium]